MADKLTSIDIAYLAGVSQPTVSRALRGSPMVSEKTRKRIETIAREVGYKIDKNASSLRLKHTSTLALLFFEDPTSDNSLINPFFLSMLGAITRKCAARGYDLLISFQQMTSNWHIEFEDSRKADGLILLGYGDYLEYRPKLDQLRECGAHFVRWGAPVGDFPGRSIGCDNGFGGRLVGAHLAGHGRTRIAFLGDASDKSPEFKERFEGLQSALAEVGLACAPALQVSAISTEQAGFDAARALMDRQVPFDAIFAASDLIAVGALRALTEAGLRVPEDVALVGFDDIAAASLTHPPLTTVMQDVRQAGEELVETLITQIERQAPGSDVVLPPRLMVRKSCGAH